MVFSEADDLEPDDRLPSQHGKVLPFPPRRAPDWLTGPADGLGAADDPDDDSTDEASPETLPQPGLRRPGGEAFTPALEPVKGEEPAGIPAEADEPPEPEVDEEPSWSRRARHAGVWAPVASSVPVPRLPLSAETAEEAPAPVHAVRVPGLPAQDEALPRLAVAPPPLAPLEEPWWVVVLDTVRASRLVQLTLAGALVTGVVLAYWMWPRGVGTTSLSEVRRYPTRFDGRAVTVRGRVGDDVFTVGSGWAFYLMQGRDTIVAFTRSQTPRPHDVVTVKGKVSTGYLDGVPRQALFEDTSAAQ